MVKSYPTKYQDVKLIDQLINNLNKLKDEKPNSEFLAPFKKRVPASFSKLEKKCEDDYLYEISIHNRELMIKLRDYDFGGASERLEGEVSAQLMRIFFIPGFQWSWIKNCHSCRSFYWRQNKFYKFCSEACQTKGYKGRHDKIKVRDRVKVFRQAQRIILSRDLSESNLQDVLDRTKARLKEMNHDNARIVDEHFKPEKWSFIKNIKNEIEKNKETKHGKKRKSQPGG